MKVQFNWIKCGQFTQRYRFKSYCFRQMFFKLGYRQVVRQLVLVQSFEGSNPSTPSIMELSTNWLSREIVNLQTRVQIPLVPPMLFQLTWYNSCFVINSTWFKSMKKHQNIVLQLIGQSSRLISGRGLFNSIKNDQNKIEIQFNWQSTTL